MTDHMTQIRVLMTNAMYTHRHLYVHSPCQCQRGYRQVECDKRATRKKERGGVSGI